MVRKIYVRSHPNIALIKYWGTVPDEISRALGIGNYPTKSSTSLSLDSLFTITRLEVYSGGRGKIREFWLNGKEYYEGSPERESIEKFIDRVGKIYGDVLKYDYSIVSMNSFPTAAGLASSASGFAAIAYGLREGVPEINKISERELTAIARQLSGSASRSIPEAGGFVVWRRGYDIHTLRRMAEGIIPYDKMDLIQSSYAYSLIPAERLGKIRILVVILSDKKKYISSREAMEISMKTDPLYWNWVEYEENNLLPNLVDAMKREKYSDVWRYTMIASDGLHSTMLRSYPRIRYMHDRSHHVADLIIDMNNTLGREVAAYSFDAGPNPVVFTTEEYVERIKNILRREGYENIIESGVGRGVESISPEVGERYLSTQISHH
ncbi:MAG: diphosphomevalonate decarboxylase [Candidatus Micrarchaeota archaeon]|nr:diphosphomevalonate decarboxylase [Candidatus Micrarchaeota archaeon]MCX8154590.1 diphosphomevalonate decarboxylase [Candidatus Micrarchaeota archaeon]